MWQVIRDGEPICMAGLIRRASVRQLRLHACACMRLKALADTPKKLMELIALAERYADGEIGPEELAAGRARRKGSLPAAWGSDFGFAFTPDDRLQRVWSNSASRNRTFEPTEPDYQ